MDQNFYIQSSIANNNKNYLFNLDYQNSLQNNYNYDKTTYKDFSNKEMSNWTPQKKGNFQKSNKYFNYDGDCKNLNLEGGVFNEGSFAKINNGNNLNNESYLGNGNDSTMMMSQPTYTKFFPRVSEGTPQRIKKSISQVYDDSKRTPIKKSKRRDCTPLYSDEEEEREAKINNNNKLEKQSEHFFTCNNNNFEGSFNFNRLRMNSGSNTNFNNNLNFNNSFRPSQPVHFQKLTKSKFLEKIENLDLYSKDNNKDVLESGDILDKIRGAYLLSLIECDYNNYSVWKDVFNSILADSELFNKITNLLCYCFFEGFNTRSDIFFKFLVRL